MRIDDALALLLGTKRARTVPTKLLEGLGFSSSLMKLVARFGWVGEKRNAIQTSTARRCSQL